MTTHMGRQVALQFAAIGVCRLLLFDFDDVELTNITTQGYEHGDISQPKVLAMQDAIGRMDRNLVVTPGLRPLPFAARSQRGRVLLCR